MNTRLTASLIFVIFVGVPTQNWAAPSPSASCRGKLTPNQKADAESLRRVEHDWLAAEMRGDTAYLQCLLADDYRDISMDGILYRKSENIAHAAKNSGKNLPIPEVHPEIVVHGTTATAFAFSDEQDTSGKPVKLHFSDTFYFDGAAWHPYFSVDAMATPGVKIKTKPN